MKGISKFFAGALIGFMLVVIAGVYQSEASPAEGKSVFA